MIIYPAIDLRGGQVVRLKEGDPEQQTTFSDNPLEIAKLWIDQGAEWIHMVNLDGAFSQQNENQAILQAVSQLPVKVQFGGGLRSMHDIDNAIKQGATRVVLGTVAIQHPDIAIEAVETYGADRICIALDAKDGRIATHGWQQTSEVTPVDFGKEMAEEGIRHALFTDVKRDGSLQGAAIEETITLGKETGLQVIASGGVSTLKEIETLRKSGHVAGAVIGMALYENKITLSEAISVANGRT